MVGLYEFSCFDAAECRWMMDLECTRWVFGAGGRGAYLEIFESMNGWMDGWMDKMDSEKVAWEWAWAWVT